MGKGGRKEERKEGRKDRREELKEDEKEVTKKKREGQMKQGMDKKTRNYPRRKM